MSMELCLNLCPLPGRAGRPCVNCQPARAADVNFRS